MFLICEIAVVAILVAVKNIRDIGEQDRKQEKCLKERDREWALMVW